MTTPEETSFATAPASVFSSECLTTNAAKCIESTRSPPSEGSQKSPFGCGCGKCTFFSFIERGCPTPISSASSFPYLDLSGLTHEQQQGLRGRLQLESQQIMIRFQELVSATIKSFQRRCIPLDDLVSHVMTLGVFNPVYKKPHIPLFRQRFEEIKAADTIPKVFMILNDYFSFFNYHIIEHIIKELGTDEDKAELQRYTEDFNEYAMRRIFECLPEFGSISDADHADVFVKLDLQYDYTLAEIEVFRHKLSEILRISSQGVLRLCRVEKGCFQLTFQLPSLVQHEIFSLSKEQEKALAAENVIGLRCGEYQFPDKDSSMELRHDINTSGRFVHVAMSVIHWKKLEDILTQNGLPQLQDLYLLTLLPQCSFRAFVYSKFQYGMNICIKAHKYSPNLVNSV